LSGSAARAANHDELARLPETHYSFPVKLIYIALFGLCGVFARYFVNVGVARFISPPYPLATFLINISGAFLIGLVYVWGVEKTALSADLRIGLMVGLLGGFTTFSSYCLEVFLLASASQRLLAVLYLVLSPILGLAATLAGVTLARMF
jgi:CrcB protein